MRIPIIRAYLEQARKTGSECQLKFVLEKPDDLAEVEDVLSQLANSKQKAQPLCDSAEVFLMPQAVNRRQMARRSAWAV